MSSAPPPAGPRLRADARRNRERILRAAGEVFAEQGIDAGTDEIARRAGVGHGTLFRRFPSKDDLVVAILQDRMESLAAQAEAALADPDPATALRAVLEQMVERQASDRCAVAAIGSPHCGSPLLAPARDRVYRALAGVLARAQEAGAVREDVTPVDLFLLLRAAAAASEIAAGPPDAWRRYLGIILDGISPVGATALAPRSPTEEELRTAIEAGHGGCGDGAAAAAQKGSKAGG